jgi:hypothetical protein
MGCTASPAAFELHCEVASPFAAVPIQFPDAVFLCQRVAQGPSPTHPNAATALA